MTTSLIEFSDTHVRFIEVDRTDGQFIIVRSELDYLGKGKITAKIEEDTDGLIFFQFTSQLQVSLFINLFIQ